MPLHDYNGTGRWSRAALEQRYAEYVRRFKVKSPADITPLEHREGTNSWVYPVMEEIIKAIERDDPAAIQIGIEFIEEDQKFPFGKILKSNTARALRRATLNSDHAENIRRRIVRMLLCGNVPHEYKQYARLLRKVGVGTYWPQVEKQIDRNNPYVMRYYRYFTRHVLPLSAI